MKERGVSHRKKRSTREKDSISTKTVKALLLCAVIFTPLSYWKFNYNPVFIVNLKRVIFNGFVLSSFILFCCTHTFHRIKASFLHYSITAFLFCCFLSLTYSFYRPATVVYLANLSGLLAFFFLVSQLFQDKKGKENICTVLVAIASIVSLYSIAQQWDIDPLNLKVYQSGLASATFINWNILAGVLIYTIPVALYKLFSSESKGSFCLYLLSLFLCITTLFLTQSRGSWLGIIGALLFFFLFARRKKMMRKSGYSFAILLLLAGVSALFVSHFHQSKAVVPRFKSITNYEDASILQRFVLYKTTVDIIKEYPVGGSGIDTFKIVYPKYQGKYLKEEQNRIFKGLSLYSHNDYLQIWSEVGVFGMISFLGIIVSVYFSGFRLIKKERMSAGEDNPLLSVALLSGFSALFIQGVFHYPFYMPETGMFFWLTCGLVSSSQTVVDREELFVSEPVKACLLIIAFFLILFSVRMFLGNIYCEEGYAFAQDKNYTQAIKRYKKSLVYNPWHADTYYFSGNAYFATGDRENALTMYGKALEQSPYFPHVYHARGGLYSKTGKLKEAEEDYKRAVDLNPNYDLAIYNLALLLQKQGRDDEAIVYFKEVIVLSPKYANGYYNMANSYYNKGLFDKAVEGFLKAIDLQPDYASAHKNIGIIYGYKKREFEKAIFHWTRYLKLSPNDKEREMILKEIDTIIKL